MEHHKQMKRHRPWRNALLVTTALSLLFLLTSHLWSVGLNQWSFVVVFLAIWVLLSVVWSNDNHIEQSTQVLARIVDYNFERLHERIAELESELEQQSQTGGEHIDRVA